MSPCRRPGECFRDQSSIRMPLGRDLVWGRTPERDLERYGTLNVIALVQGASSFLHAAVTDSIEDALKAKAMYSDRITKLRQTTQSFESNNAHPELYRLRRTSDTDLGNLKKLISESSESHLRDRLRKLRCLRHLGDDFRNFR